MYYLSADNNGGCPSYTILNKLRIMNKNMGSADRIIRIVIAAIVTFLYFNGTITGTLGIVLIAVAGIFLLTSLVSFCPLYTIFGIRTCPAKNE